jgi:undecaprenyl-diphosphatase
LLKSLHGKGENAVGVTHIDGHGWIVLAIGFVVSFVVAYAAVAWFLAWVRKHGFVPFAIYRIIVGLVVLAWATHRIG